MSHADTAVALDKSNEAIKAMFAGIAPRYDLLNHLLSLNVDRWWRSYAVRRVPLDPASDLPVLDVCTGTGDLALAYAAAAKRLGKPLEIIGGDFCPPMLERARLKDAAGAVRFKELDAQALPFPADMFQVVTVAFGLRNQADTDQGLREMVRVAAPGGRVAVLEFSRPGGLLGWCYRTYFTRLLPAVGNWVAPNRAAAYRYLPESVMAFPDGEELCARMRAAGLGEVTHTPLTFGIATLYVGRKPA